MISPYHLSKCPKVACGTAKQQAKKAENKEVIQIFLGFNMKILFLSPKTETVSLILRGAFARYIFKQTTMHTTHVY